MDLQITDKPKSFGLLSADRSRVWVFVVLAISTSLFELSEELHYSHCHEWRLKSSFNETLARGQGERNIGVQITQKKNLDWKKPNCKNKGLKKRIHTKSVIMNCTKTPWLNMLYFLFSGRITESIGLFNDKIWRTLVLNTNAGPDSLEPAGYYWVSPRIIIVP